jgi:hypothetical protein
MEAAVVSSTEGVLRILLGKLGAVLTEKYVLLSGVAREIQELKEDLEIMNACLRDLAAGTEYHQHSEQVIQYFFSQYSSASFQSFSLYFKRHGAYNTRLIDHTTLDDDIK